MILFLVINLSIIALSPRLETRETSRSLSSITKFKIRLRSIFKNKVRPIENERELVNKRSLPLYSVLETLSNKRLLEQEGDLFLNIQNYLLGRSDTVPWLSNRDFRYHDIIHSQSEAPEETALMEVITNAIDASVPDWPIGKFSRGVKQLLVHLQDEGDQIRVISRKKGSKKVYQLTIWKSEKGLEISLNEGQDSFLCGTKVELIKAFSSLNEEALKEEAQLRYASIGSVKVKWNDMFLKRCCLNIEGNKQTEEQAEINIQCFSSYFSCEDRGIGMDEKALLNMFVPMTTRKKRKEEESSRSQIYIDETVLKTNRISRVGFSRFGETIVNSQLEESEGGMLIVELGIHCQVPESRRRIRPSYEMVDAIVETVEREILSNETLSNIFKVRCIQSIYRCMKDHIDLENSYESIFCRNLSTQLIEKIEHLLRCLLQEGEYIFLDQDLSLSGILNQDRECYFLDKDLLPESIEKESLRLVGAKEVGISKRSDEKRVVYTFPLDIKEDIIMSNLLRVRPLPVFRSSRIVLIPEQLFHKEGLIGESEMSLFISPICDTSYERSETQSSKEILTLNKEIKKEEENRKKEAAESEMLVSKSSSSQEEESSVQIGYVLQRRDSLSEKIREPTYYNIKGLKESNLYIEQRSSEGFVLVRKKLMLKGNTLVLKKNKIPHQYRSINRLHIDSGQRFRQIKIKGKYIIFENSQGLWGICHVTQVPYEDMCQWHSIRLSQYSDHVIFSTKNLKKINFGIVPLDQALDKSQCQFRSVEEVSGGNYFIVQNQKGKFQLVLDSGQVIFSIKDWKNVHNIGGNGWVSFQNKKGEKRVCLTQDQFDIKEVSWGDMYELSDSQTVIFSNSKTTKKKQVRWAIPSIGQMPQKEDFIWKAVKSNVGHNEEQKVYAVCDEFNKWGLYRQGQDKIDVKCQWEDIKFYSTSSGDYVAFKKNGLWGYCPLNQPLSESLCQWAEVLFSKELIAVRSPQTQLYSCGNIVFFQPSLDSFKWKSVILYETWLIVESQEGTYEVIFYDDIEGPNYEGGANNYSYLKKLSNTELVLYNEIRGRNTNYAYILLNMNTYFRLPLSEFGGLKMCEFKILNGNFINLNFSAFIYAFHQILKHVDNSYRIGFINQERPDWMLKELIKATHFLDRVRLNHNNLEQLVAFYMNCLKHSFHRNTQTLVSYLPIVNEVKHELERYTFTFYSPPLMRGSRPTEYELERRAFMEHTFLQFSSYFWEGDGNIVDYVNCMGQLSELFKEVPYQNLHFIYSFLAKNTKSLENLAFKIQTLPDEEKRKLVDYVREYKGGGVNRELLTYLEYLVSDSTIEMKSSYSFPSSIVEIDLTQLNENQSIKEHVQMFLEGRLPPLNKIQREFLLETIEHSLEGDYAREYIQNTKDSGGNQIQIEYDIVLKEDQSTGQLVQYLAERSEDNSTAPPSLVPLLISDLSTKKEDTEKIGHFGNGSLTYLDGANMVIYEVYHEKESCKICIENGKIIAYEELQYDGKPRFIMTRFHKLTETSMPQFMGKQLISNWKHHAQSVKERDCKVTVKVNEHHQITEQVINQDFRYHVVSQDIIQNKKNVEVSVCQSNQDLLFKRTEGVRIVGSSGLYICTLYPKHKHYKELFELIPEQWRDIIHREGIFFQIKAPLIRDRSFFEWGEKSAKEEVQFQVAVSFISYLAKQFLENRHFVVPMIPEDLMSNEQYDKRFKSNLLLSLKKTKEDWIKSISKRLKSFVKMNQVQQEEEAVQLLVSMPFVHFEGELSNLAKEREWIFLKKKNQEKEYLNEWEEKRKSLTQSFKNLKNMRVMNAVKIVNCRLNERQKRRYEIFSQLLGGLEVPVEIIVFKNKIGVTGWSNVKEQKLYLTQKLFDEDKYTWSEAWETLCHELTHFYEFYEKIIIKGNNLAVSEERHSCKDNHLTHQKDGHFTHIYRLVSAELSRRFKLLFCKYDQVEPESLYLRHQGTEQGLNEGYLFLKTA